MTNMSAKMADRGYRINFSTMRKQAVLCNTVFLSKAGLLHACYMLVEPLKKGVFGGVGFWGENSLPKWQTTSPGPGIF